MRPLLLLCCLTAAVYAEERYAVLPVTPDVRRAHRLDRFYVKYIDAGGIPVVSSAAPDDYALKEAAYLIERMLEPIPRVRRALVRFGLRCAVIGVGELTTDIPEYRTLQPKNYWDYRARGLGPTASRRCVACSEENLLQTASDPYRGESIFVHEFGHAIQRGLEIVDPQFTPRVKARYGAAMKAGLWRGAYASETAGEYWAEGVQSWFDTNQLPDDNHPGVENREKLKAYDPGLAGLLGSVFGETGWRYETVAKRAAPGHLAGFDPARVPAFKWPPRLLEWYRLYREGREPGRTELRRLPAAAARALRSVRRGPPTDIVFLNKTKSDVDLVAVGPRGERLPRGSVRPGRLRHVGTQVGHAWLVTEPGGRLLSAVIARPRPGRVVIDGSPAPRRPDIVLVTVEGLGATAPSKALHLFAGEGLRFTNAYAGSPVAGRSLATLFTGLHTGHAPRAPDLRTRLEETGYGRGPTFRHVPATDVDAALAGLPDDKNTVVIVAGVRGPEPKGLSERSLRVPLVVRWPGVIRARATSDHLCALWDLFPTILELAGAKVPDGLDGRSLVPALFATGDQPRHPYLYWEVPDHGGHQAILMGYWKGVRRGLAADPKAPLALYNLRDDPDERTDIAEAQPGIARHMMRTLRAARKPSRWFPFPALD